MHFKINSNIVNHHCMCYFLELFKLLSSIYSRTPIKQPPIKRPTSVKQPLAISPRVAA